MQGISSAALDRFSASPVFPYSLPQGKPQTLAVKRKADSEEEKEESPSATALLPAKSSPVADSPKNIEEKSGLGGEWATKGFDCFG